jgi:hypothetical protein
MPMDALLDNDLATLAERVSQASVLREHHVWEAAKALCPQVRQRGMNGSCSASPSWSARTR